MSDHGHRILAAVLEAAGVSIERSADGVAQVHLTESGCGAVFCSWCSNFIRTEPALKAGEVSHGICGRCAKTLSDGANHDETMAVEGPPPTAAPVSCTTGFRSSNDPLPLIDAAKVSRPKLSPEVAQ